MKPSNSFKLFFAVLVSGILGVWIFSKLLPQSAPLQPPPTQPTEYRTIETQKSPPRFKIIPADSHPVPKLSGGAPERPDGNLIEYKIVDGFAVAYGDMLLGKPRQGETATHGYYDAPTPQLWTYPEIPYLINSDLPNPSRVEKALEYFKQHTPVSFIPYSGQTDAIVFEVGTNNCLSALGKIGGLQPIRLSNGCQTPEIIHEIMHALGFIHEQSRPDRDQYVQVLWDNIEEDFISQYNVVPDTFTAALRGASFDYHSVMLYRTNSFARQPNLPTMQSLTTELIDPVKDGLSDGDIKRLNNLYNGHE